MLSMVVGILFVLVLVAGVPALSFLTARKSEIRHVPRSALYFSAVLSQWALATIATAVVLVTFQTFLATGFQAVPAPVFFRTTALLTVISLAGLGVFLFLERLGWWPPESELVYLLMPQTRQEKVWCVLVLAPTAAFCEEFLYRGYLLAQLSLWFHSTTWGWLSSSVAFGMAHAYQGYNGMARAAMLGALLAYPVVYFGSLYPSMATHFLIDALALAWLGPEFLRRNPSP